MPPHTATSADRVLRTFAAYETHPLPVWAQDLFHLWHEVKHAEDQVDAQVALHRRRMSEIPKRSALRVTLERYNHAYLDTLEAFIESGTEALILGANSFRRLKRAIGLALEEEERVPESVLKPSDLDTIREALKSVSPQRKAMTEALHRYEGAYLLDHWFPSHRNAIGSGKAVLRSPDDSNTVDCGPPNAARMERLSALEEYMLRHPKATKSEVYWVVAKKLRHSFRTIQRTANRVNRAKATFFDKPDKAAILDPLISKKPAS